MAPGQEMQTEHISKPAVSADMPRRKAAASVNGNQTMMELIQVPVLSAVMFKVKAAPPLTAQL